VWLVSGRLVSWPACSLAVTVSVSLSLSLSVALLWPAASSGRPLQRNKGQKEARPKWRPVGQRGGGGSTFCRQLFATRKRWLGIRECELAQCSCAVASRQSPVASWQPTVGGLQIPNPGEWDARETDTNSNNNNNNNDKISETARRRCSVGARACISVNFLADFFSNQERPVHKRTLPSA